MEKQLCLFYFTLSPQWESTLKKRIAPVEANTSLRMDPFPKSFTAKGSKQRYTKFVSLSELRQNT